MTLQDQSDLFFMQQALRLAEQAAAADEVPVGAIVVHNNEIVAEARNETIALCDPSAHAEVLAIRRAAIALSNHRLNNTTLYVTLEPCLMCCGCLLHARVARLVFAAREPKTGAVVSINEALADPAQSHSVRVTEGVLANECKATVQAFFKSRRQ